MGGLNMNEIPAVNISQVIILIFVFVLIIVVLKFAENAIRVREKINAITTDMPYKLIPSLLTAREASFFVVLAPIAAELGLHVFVKPRIADFVGVTLDRYVKGSKFNTYFNPIAKKHIDFLLCDSDFKPVAGFEVDDKSHSKARN